MMVGDIQLELSRPMALPYSLFSHSFTLLSQQQTCTPTAPNFDWLANENEPYQTLANTLVPQ